MERTCTAAKSRTIVLYDFVFCGYNLGVSPNDFPEGRPASLDQTEIGLEIDTAKSSRMVKEVRRASSILLLELD